MPNFKKEEKTNGKTKIIGGVPKRAVGKGGGTSKSKTETGTGGAQNESDEKQDQDGVKETKRCQNPCIMLQGGTFGIGVSGD